MLAAIIRIGPKDFLMYDVATRNVHHEFTVLPTDDYLKKNYNQIVFCDFDETRQISHEILSVSVSGTDDASEIVLKDLPRLHLFGQIDKIYQDLRDRLENPHSSHLH